MKWLTESEIQATLPESIARENMCIPFLRIGSTLLIATPNPDAEYLRERLSFVLDQCVRMVARHTDWIQSRIESVYSIQPRLRDETRPSASTSYWAQCARHDGSSLFVAASGVRTSLQSYSQWSGEVEFPIDHPDRDFWEWLVTIEAFKRVLTERDLVAIRRIWQRSRRRSLRA